MLFSVDFSIKVNGLFSTIYTALIHAISVSECMYKAERIKEEKLVEFKNQQVHIFIEE